MSYSLNDRKCILNVFDFLQIAQESCYAGLCGVTYPQLRILICLAVCGPLLKKDLASRLHISAGRVTQSMSILERRGFAGSEICITDRRSQKVFLTNQGREQMEKFLDFFYENLREKIGDPMVFRHLMAAFRLVDF